VPAHHLDEERVPLCGPDGGHVADDAILGASRDEVWCIALELAGVLDQDDTVGRPRHLGTDLAGASPPLRLTALTSCPAPAGALQAARDE
jgi:hypothetical protein